MGAPALFVQTESSASCGLTHNHQRLQQCLNGSVISLISFAYEISCLDALGFPEQAKGLSSSARTYWRRVVLQWS